MPDLERTEEGFSSTYVPCVHVASSLASIVKQNNLRDLCLGLRRRLGQLQVVAGAEGDGEEKSGDSLGDAKDGR